MPLANILNEFNKDVSQCDHLIANAHKIDSTGKSILPLLDQKQITVAAFLNLFIAWEFFLESSLIDLMLGNKTLSGTAPIRYVTPINEEAARAFIVGIRPYFDYGNQEFMKKIVKMYFNNGYPYEPHLSAINSELSDLKTMRNASAHITSTTQKALYGLALRIFARPYPNIELYTLLTMIDPRSANKDTVYFTYKNKLIVTAELIAKG